MNLDSDNFDFRPRTRRSNGGLAGIAARLVCHGDLGSSEDKSSNQSSSNQQVTLQGGGDGSTTVGVGAGATVNYTVQSLDSNVAQAAADLSNNALTVANNATTNAEITAGNAIGASVQDLTSSLGFGAEVVASNTAIDQQALGTTTTLNAQDIGAEEFNIQNAYNFAAGAVNQIESDNAQQAGFNAQTIQNLGVDLAYASGVNQPATTALSTPITDTVPGKTDWSTYIGIGAGLLAIYTFFLSGGKTT